MVLPSSREDIAKYPAVFEAIEDQQDPLGIESYGVSITSLEEVFLRLAELAEMEEANETSDKPGSSALVVSLVYGYSATVFHNLFPGTDPGG